jgi:anti-sigma factor RsiW
MNRSFYNLLLRSLDSPLTDDERRALDAALASSEELRSAEKNLAAMRSAIRSAGEGGFKPFFVERVTERLRRPQESVDDYFVSVFRTLAAGAAVLVILLSAYNISQTNAVSVESAFGIHHPSFDQVLTLEVPFE